MNRGDILERLREQLDQYRRWADLPLAIRITVGDYSVPTFGYDTMLQDAVDEIERLRHLANSERATIP